jgi:hypothetical protein
MSSSFDFMARVFKERFEPKSGDWYEKHLFEMMIQDIHSANHDLGDKINRNPRLRKTIQEYQDFLKGGGEEDAS